jgi:hypothetical protein
MFNGHSGEGTIKKSNKTATYPTMNKIDGRFSGNRVNYVCPDVDLIKRDARSWDCGSAT